MERYVYLVSNAEYLSVNMAIGLRSLVFVILLMIIFRLPENGRGTQLGGYYSNNFLSLIDIRNLPLFCYK
jgi:hypothetical protein